MNSLRKTHIHCAHMRAHTQVTFSVDTVKTVEIKSHTSIHTHTRRRPGLTNALIACPGHRRSLVLK